MVDAREMHTWSDDRIEAEIEHLLEDFPTKLVFHIGGETYWDVWFEQEADPKILWRGGHLDRRLALFEAYGYLWLQMNKAPTGVWAPPANRPTVREVSQHVAERYSDPEDLDPKEVASVYGRNSPPKRGE